MALSDHRQWGSDNFYQIFIKTNIKKRTEGEVKVDRKEITPLLLETQEKILNI